MASRHARPTADVQCIVYRVTEPPDNAPPPRYVPQRSFPPYSYVPGKFPHPLSDPAGHSYGVPPVAGDDAFLQAVDLFNHGYYWEAHEAWESLWHAAGRTGPRADFLKGLIKLAAAGVKAREGNAAGVARHARRAVELFTSIRGDRQEGCALPDLIALAAAIEQAAPRLINTSDEPVLRVFRQAIVVRDD